MNPALSGDTIAEICLPPNLGFVVNLSNPTLSEPDTLDLKKDKNSTTSLR